jgi:thioredoxin 1
MVEFTDYTFDAATTSGKVVLVDFFAEWCGPCNMMAPIVKELSKEFGDKAVIGKVDVDRFKSLATTYGIKSIPAFVFIKDGKVLDKVVGACSKQVLEDKLKSLLSESPAL